MNNQTASTEVNIDEILHQATIKQVDWLMARLVVDSDAKAAKAVKVRPETVCRWPNKKDLDKVLRYYKLNQVPAVRAMLKNAAIDAAGVMVSELRGKQKLKAAAEILDRSGHGRSASVDLTSDNKPLIPTLGAVLEKVYGDDDKPNIP